MNIRLFDNIDYDKSDWVIEEFFNSIYSQGEFLWALKLIIEKNGCGINETYCSFPDLNDPDPEYHFEGIMFGVWEGEIIVSEETGFKYISLACEKYLQLHPEDAENINELLIKIPS